MLADERSRSLVENFADQWLYLRNLKTITPDMRLFPDFDENLRQAMRRETELLFERVVREDRSVLDLLKSRETFLNERLAKHYGIPGVYGSRFRAVELGAQCGTPLRGVSPSGTAGVANDDPKDGLGRGADFRGARCHFGRRTRWRQASIFTVYVVRDADLTGDSRQLDSENLLGTPAPPLQTTCRL